MGGDAGETSGVTMHVCDIEIKSRCIPAEWRKIVEREAAKVYRCYATEGEELDQHAMCLTQTSLCDMLEMLQAQRYKQGDTMKVFVVGMGDGREAVAIAAACSAVDWCGPRIEFVGIDNEQTPIDDFDKVNRCTMLYDIQYHIISHGCDILCVT